MLVVVLVTVTGFAAWLGAAVVARHRAQSAADLAALAAAAALPAGADAACRRARRVAAGAVVTDCRVEGLDLVVVVEVGVPVRLPGLAPATARAAARAGPVAENSPADS
ncbi:Rv3654c family TadE-like protein [Mycolicibacterium fallax]|uniref:Rv3654c family TadE-like protein n=1 Tax=Mycolicibacterium fallax TaxID=1793 RepID=UPI001F2B51C5|nr:Rv3654c family TadE-like protein [Mycolicibacterium fallax]HOW95814.1 pilus assembly protein TadG-related protein [Mycolicibacterium fallax]